MFDKVKFDACVDWVYANRALLIPRLPVTLIELP